MQDNTVSSNAPAVPQMPSQAADAPLQLRQAREMAGLHVAMLASMLKVPVKKLEALEAGRFDQLPDLVFARALAQSVCRQLKIDPGPILAALPQAPETWRDTSARDLSAPFVPARESGKSSGTGEKQQLSTPFVLAVLLLVAAGVLWWALPTRLGTPLAGSEALVTETIMPPASAPQDGTLPVPAVAPLEASPSEGAPGAPATPDAPPDSASTGPGEPAVSAGSAGSAVADAAVTASPATASPAPTAPAPSAAPAPTGNETLRLRVAETTWVEVLGQGARVVVQRNLQPGESIALSQAAPLSVVVGRADAAEVWVRGQRFVLEPYTRNNVARFEVR